MPKPRLRKDLTGLKFNRLTVISEAPIGKYWKVRWNCKCDCGNTAIVQAERLVSGHTKSCGCLQKEAARKSGKAQFQGSTNAFNVTIYQYKKNAELRNLEWCLTSEDVKFLFKQNCFYCNKPPSKFQVKKSIIFKNGLDRLDSNKGYLKENVVACCKVCNYAKRGLTVFEFVSWAERVVRNMNGESKCLV